MRTPPTTRSGALRRSVAAVHRAPRPLALPPLTTLAAGLLLVGLGGCMAPGATGAGPATGADAGIYEPPDALPEIRGDGRADVRVDVRADAGPPYGVPPTAVPPPTMSAPPTARAVARPVPAVPAPIVVPRPTPAAVPSGAGSTTDPGSRYLPLSEPVGAVPAETPPLGYR